MTELSAIELRHLGGSNFELTRVHPSGTSHSIPLTGDEVLVMAHRMPLFARQVLASQNPSVASLPGLELASVAAVTGSKLGLDVYRAMIGLSLSDQAGLTMNYSLTSESARDIGGKLTALADKLDAAAPTRQ
jgi:hypothetical protein